MLKISQIHKMAKQRRARVGIGDFGGADVITRSAAFAEEKGFAKVAVYDNPEQLVSGLRLGEVDAAVRGTLGAKDTLSALKSGFETDRILRTAFLAMDDGKLVLLAPVGVDEGQSVDERLELVERICEILAKLDVGPHVGVLSGGRPEDAGRHIKVDETLMEGEKLTNRILDLGIPARHFGIVIEQAVLSSNLIVAPDGITGNLIFRTLHFLGGAKGMGAPVVNIDSVFVDTTRAKEGYTDSIALASALCGIYKNYQ